MSAVTDHPATFQDVATSVGKPADRIVAPASGRGTARPAGGRAHLPYAPGLDGVRAVAVVAVVVFHLGTPWLPGGFLGVDVFFTLSGFLITGVLLREFEAGGHIDIRAFYLRRARRLLPALFVVLAAVTLAAWLVARDELYRLRGDVVAALTYSTNWTQIAWNRSYFEQLGRPSLLQHLWSLAVEEQFYLLWPVVLVACLAARRRATVVVVPAALAVVSLVLMAVLFHPGQDPARVYYGSDTHLSPMLIGAVVAILVARRRQAGRVDDSRFGAGLADAAALAGGFGLGWAMVAVGDLSTGLYRGGYLFVGLAAVAVAYAAQRPGTSTARLLGAEPLVWLGQRSYAIYLWHWPILELSRPGIDTTWPTPVVVLVQIATILLAAHLSYTYVERPIRTHGLVTTVRAAWAWSRGGSSTRPARARRGTVVAVLVGVPVLVLAVLGTAPTTAPAGVQVDTAHGRVTLTVPPTSAPGAGTTTFAHPVRVSFFGDSQGMTLLLNRPNGLQSAMTLSDATVEGCGVLLGTISSSTGYRRDLDADCGTWPARWRAGAIAHHPQIAVVEIGAWDVFDDTVNGQTLTFGSPAWDAYFTRQLDQGVKILTDAGAQVALMGVPCYRPIAAGGLPLLPERGDDTHTRHVTALLAAAAARQPQRVFTVDPPAAFCDDPAIGANTSYRWDGTHYYIPGAALVFQTITPQLLAIPRRPGH